MFKVISVVVVLLLDDEEQSWATDREMMRECARCCSYTTREVGMQAEVVC